MRTNSKGSRVMAALSTLVVAAGLGLAPALGPYVGPWAPSASAQAADGLSPQQAAALLRDADGSRARGFDRGVFTLRVTQQHLDDPARPPDVAVIRVYVEQASDKKGGQLVVFEEPRNMRGNTFLVRGSDTWMYRPGLRSPLRISAQQRAFGDAGVSEAAGILFGAEYDVHDAAGDVLDGEPAWRLELVARSPSAPYQRATVWIGRDDGLYRRAVLYSLSGMALKQLDYEEWGQVSGRFALVRMAVRDLLQAGRRTVTVIETLAIAERSIPSRFFQPEFLSSAPLLLGQ